MSRGQPGSLLDRLIAEAQADDYALAEPRSGPRSAKSAVVGAVLFVVIGVLFATAAWQWQSVQTANQDRREVLIDRIVQADDRAEERQAEVVDLRASVSQLQQLATSGLGDDFAEQLQAVQIVSGFVGLTGPGATLTMADAVPPLPSGVTPDEAKVLDIDVQTAVNGLWEAGAQAIAINDIRLTSVTAIRTAGEAILVDYRPLEPPYRIAAVGPPDLPEAFAKTQAQAELDGLQRDYGIQSDLEASQSVSVPASTASLPIRAEVMKGGGG
jgi:uncharacterized protein YlxW (UPF0749 family)